MLTEGVRASAFLRSLIAFTSLSDGSSTSYTRTRVGAITLATIDVGDHGERAAALGQCADQHERALGTRLRHDVPRRSSRKTSSSLARDRSRIRLVPNTLPPGSTIAHRSHDIIRLRCNAIRTARVRWDAIPIGNGAHTIANTCGRSSLALLGRSLPAADRTHHWPPWATWPAGESAVVVPALLLGPSCARRTACSASCDAAESGGAKTGRGARSLLRVFARADGRRQPRR